MVVAVLIAVVAAVAGYFGVRAVAGWTGASASGPAAAAAPLLIMAHSVSITPLQD